MNDSSLHSPVRRLIGTVSLYTVARAAAGTVRVLTIPFILHAVSASTFGTLATLWTPLMAMHVLSELGVGTAALRLSPECEGPEERRSLFATMIAARMGGSLAFSVLVAFAHEPIARWVTGTEGNGRVFLLMVLARPFAAVSDTLADGFRAQGAWSKVATLMVLGACLAQGASILFTVGFGLELDGLVWARVVCDGTLCAVAAGMGLDFFRRGRPQLKFVRPLLAFGWPICVLYLLGTLRALDRPLLRSFTSLEQVGAYELGTRLVGPIGVFNIAVGTVLEPFIYGHSRTDTTPVWIDRYVRAYVTAFSALAMALSVVGPELVALVAPEPYRVASRVLPPLAFALTCEGLQRAAGVGAELAKKTRVWAVAGFVTLVLGLLVSRIALPRFGIIGIGMAWVLAVAIGTVLVYRIAREVSGIRLPVSRALVVIFVGALLGTVAAWDPWPLGARLVLFVGFALATNRLMGVRWSELKALI